MDRFTAQPQLQGFRLTVAAVLPDSTSRLITVRAKGVQIHMAQRSVDEAWVPAAQLTSVRASTQARPGAARVGRGDVYAWSNGLMRISLTFTRRGWVTA